MYTDVIKVVLLTKKKSSSAPTFHVRFSEFYVAFEDCLVLVVFGFLWCVLLDTG